MCSANDTIFRANRKAIIGLSEITRRISLLIKSNFWRTRYERGPEIDNGLEKFIIQCNCALLQSRMNEIAGRVILKTLYFSVITSPPFLTLSHPFSPFPILPRPVSPFLALSRP